MIYASFGIANKEPNRSDYTESSTNSRPKHEALYDTEIGYKQKDKTIKMLQKKDFYIKKVLKDYGNNYRCIISAKI